MLPETRPVPVATSVTVPPTAPGVTGFQSEVVAFQVRVWPDVGDVLATVDKKLS
jgi:hypothetical protein